MAEIHCLTLDLVYYYLYKGFAVTKKDVIPFNEYWKVFESKYPKHKDGYLDLIHEDFSGKFYHIEEQLEDTNIFLLDCSVKADKIYTPDVISKLKEQIETPADTTKVSLGYTWMIYGWGKFEEQDIEDLYEKLVDKKDGKVEEKGRKWDFQRRGEISGATVVEAWKSVREWDVPEVGSHVLIILYPDEKTYKKASEMLHHAWIPLLWYRHKIWYSYKESRDNKEEILSAFNKAVPKDLGDYEKYNLSSLKKSLEKNLKTLTSYSIGLNNIGIHQQTLSTNSHNYTLAVRDFLKIG